MSKNPENPIKKALFRPLAFWFILTLIYGVALFVLGNYEVVSLVYHIGLLSGAVYFAKGRAGLGLRVGNFRYGVVLCVGLFGYLILRVLIWGMPQFDFGFDLATFSTLFFAPITEELFWRGLIMQRMLNYPKIDYMVAAVANAGLFTLMHVPKILFLNLGMATLLPILFLGLVFALIFYLSKSVYYPTITHILSNIFAS